MKRKIWACWDCSQELSSAVALCDSCRKHRADGHEPVMTLITPPRKGNDGELLRDSDGNWLPALDYQGHPVKIPDGWCHGAGPSGRQDEQRYDEPIPHQILVGVDDE